MMRYFLRLGTLTLAAVLFFVLGLADADSGVYTWTDERGVLVFTDNPTLVPEGVTAKHWLAASSEQRVTIAPRMADAVTSRPKRVPGDDAKEQYPEFPVRAVSQGAFAMQLTRELGLGQNLSPRNAAQTLSDIRISPVLGEWFLDQAMTAALTTRLRTLTVSAPQMGWLSITPEQALLAFDTAAALMGLPIPLPSETGGRDTSEPTLSVPPLVYLFPPPTEIATSYVWVSVLSSFSFYDRTVHGYYVLHGSYLNGHRFNGHRFAFNRHALQSHFSNYFSEHRDGQIDATHNLGRDKRHHEATIAPPSHPMRHRKNVRHNRNMRRSHLRKAHNNSERIHPQSETKRHQVVDHPSSGLCPHVRQKHVLRKSHAILEKHSNAQSHTTSPQHRSGGNSHNGGHAR